MFSSGVLERPRKRAFALEQLFGVGRQIARKGRDLRIAVEGLAADLLARGWCSQNRGQLVAAALHLASRVAAHRGQRHHVDLRAGIFRPVGRLGDNPPQDGFKPVMAE